MEKAKRDELTDKDLLFQYGDEAMTLCVCDGDGIVCPDAPMAVARTHRLDRACAVAKEDWRRLAEFAGREQAAGLGPRPVRAFFGEDVFSVRAKAESRSYVGLELMKD